MIYSKSGLALTESFEGYSANAYQDQGGRWTCGYGHTGPGVNASTVCTQEQALSWLEADIEFATKCVNILVTQSIDQGQFDALVDFAFNLGCLKLANSTLLKLVNKGDFEGAAAEFVNWDYIQGKQSVGLRRRRLAETAEFKS